jgi:hypothetical protein
VQFSELFGRGQQQQKIRSCNPSTKEKFEKILNRKIKKQNKKQLVCCTEYDDVNLFFPLFETIFVFSGFYTPRALYPFKVDCFFSIFMAVCVCVCVCVCQYIISFVIGLGTLFDSLFLSPADFIMLMAGRAGAKSLERDRQARSGPSSSVRSSIDEIDQTATHLQPSPPMAYHHIPPNPLSEISARHSDLGA